MTCGTCGGDHPTPWVPTELARCIDSLGKLVEALNKRVARLEAQIMPMVLCHWAGTDEGLFRDHGAPEGHCTHCAAAKFDADLKKAEAALGVLGTGKLRKE